MKRALTKNMLGLINCHALPTEIKDIEEVPNTKLLEQFHPKLLATVSASDEAFTQVKPEGRKVTRANKRVIRTSSKKRAG